MKKAVFYLEDKKEFIELPKYISDLWDIFDEMDIENEETEGNEVDLPNSFDKLFVIIYDALVGWIHNYVIENVVLDLNKDIHVLVFDDWVDVKDGDDALFGVKLEKFEY